jgi:hypothetical protein
MERVVIGSHVEERKFIEGKSKIPSFAPTRFLEEF